MSAFRGILTGYGMAAIKNKEAKDNAKMEIVKSAGIDFLENKIPQHEKEIKLYDSDYKAVELVHGPDIANLFGDAEAGFYGTGKGLQLVNQVLEKNNIDKDKIKNFKFSTQDQRIAKKKSAFQSKKDQILNLTGIGGIGTETAKNQLEGFGEDSSMMDTQTQVTDQSQTTDTTTQDTEEPPKLNADISSLFTPKASTRGVETKYRQIPIAINEKYGYGENIKMANGEFKFVPTGTLAKTANAHIALAEIISANDDTINQYGAADQAKNMLVNLTEMPFISLEQTLGGKYEAGDGGKTALMSGAGNNIDANKVQYNGQSISEYLLDFVVNQIPVDPQGNIDKAIIDKFIENIPSNLMYSKDESMAERLDRKVKETNFFNTLG
jgi:3-dehydroquinate dehydratase